MKVSRDKYSFIEWENNKMADITELELQHIRQLIFTNDNQYQKINSYLTQVKDIQIQQLFNKAMQESLNTKQTLKSFINK